MTRGLADGTRPLDRATPIRVLHVIKALGRGGAEVLLREGFSVADPERVHLEYASLRDRPDDLVDELRSAGALVHELGFRSDARLLLAAGRLSQLVRDRRVDIVHAHLPLAGAVARIAGVKTGVPVVYTEHTVPERYGFLSGLANRLTWRWQDVGICITNDVQDSVIRHYGRGVSVEVVTSGVNTDRFNPRVVPTSPEDPWTRSFASDFVVGTVAVFRNTPAKRLDLWIDSVALVMKEHPRVQALLVGDGELRKRLEEQVVATGLACRFHFVGRQTDVRPFLARMNVFLMSSAYEGFGVAPAEAMAMGVPVVATEVSGVREVVRHGETGFLVPFDDNVVTGLADAVGRLVVNPALADQLGGQARTHVQDNLSLNRMQRELEEIYERTLATRKGNRL